MFYDARDDRQAGKDLSMKQYVLTAMIVTLLAGVGRARADSTESLDNWPAWRGPLVNGVAPHADPPVKWNASENIKWTVDLPGQSNATPIIWGNRVFVVTAVESERTVDRLSAPTMEPPGGYKTRRPRHYYQFRVYFTKTNQPVLSCLDAKTGKPLMEAVRLPELRDLYASPLGAADRNYFVGRDGTTVVIRNQPELEVLAVNLLDDPIDASPAAVGGELFLRSRKRLCCIARTKP